MKQIVLSALIAIGFLFISCNQNSGEQKKEVIAEINGIEINSSELDNLVQQELYDELNRIYNIRDLALSELIEVKVLEQEALKYNMTVSEFIRHHTDSVIKKHTYDSLVHKYQIDGTANMIYKTSMVAVPANSYEGRLNQINSLQYRILSELIDS
ncbi:MAG: SurA N-terminal domain-containing protein, partial [Prevotella sp.]|nr:SurA N-terminal domain-containing protein [Prevotella sp.]